VLRPVAQLGYAVLVPPKISQRELRNDSGAIMRRVEQGERFIVTRNGVPVAELIPHDPTALDIPPQFVPVAQIAAGISRLPSWDLERFKREQKLLDEAIDDRDGDRWSNAR
jgi:prevent-host-death family protein